MIRRVVISVLLFVFASSAAAQDSKYLCTVYIPGGFLKGRDFLEMSSQTKEAYSMGFLNGLLVSPALRGDQDTTNALNECIKDMRSDQIAAIIEKHIRANPAEWHNGVHMLSLAAFEDTCPSMKAAISKACKNRP